MSAGALRSMQIRDYRPATDYDGIRRCLVELQDFERDLDARLPGGEDIVDEYIPQLLRRCVRYAGKVIVADLDSAIAGYVSIWTRVTSGELEDGDLLYGYVSDIVVRQEYRGAGVGRRLLEAAEDFARDNDVRYLRIAVLAANRMAHDLYRAAGFADYSVEMEKTL
ncbi:MAG: GNAT family N-acetyltransferase [Gammaproteobacteria bacterium]|nr:GNAT family N-acetyltransferase [Gammaproteobacteria bacterium]